MGKSKFNKYCYYIKDSPKKIKTIAQWKQIIAFWKPKICYTQLYYKKETSDICKLRLNASDI